MSQSTSSYSISIVSLQILVTPLESILLTLHIAEHTLTYNFEDFSTVDGIVLTHNICNPLLHIIIVCSTKLADMLLH